MQPTVSINNKESELMASLLVGFAWLLQTDRANAHSATVLLSRGTSLPTASSALLDQTGAVPRALRPWGWRMPDFCQGLGREVTKSAPDPFVQHSSQQLHSFCTYL